MLQELDANASWTGLLLPGNKDLLRTIKGRRPQRVAIQQGSFHAIAKELQERQNCHSNRAPLGMFEGLARVRLFAHDMGFLACMRR